MKTYSVNLPADAHTFVGYSEGENSPPTICRRLSQSGVPSSFWIKGEARSGRTSFLRRLEILLRNTPPEPGADFIPFPLYLSCAEHDSLPSLVRAIAQSLESALPNLRTATGPNGPQLRLAGEGRITAQELLPALWDDLSLAASALQRRMTRFVLLLDDIECAVEGEWAAKLLPTLRILVTSRPPAESEENEEAVGLCSENVRVVLASSPRMLSVPTFASLAPLLGTVKLSPLGLADVRELVQIGGGNGDLAEKVFSAAGGHPFLSQLVLEQFARSGQAETAFADWLARMSWSRLNGDPRLHSLPARWIANLPEQGTVILSLLVLAKDGASFSELAAGLAEHGLAMDAPALAVALETLIDRGLIYRPPSAPDRLAVCHVVKRWFLEVNGGIVFEHAIKRLSISKPTAPEAARPFSLLLSLEHDVMVADGRYTRLFALDKRFAEEAARLHRDARRAETVQHLHDIRGRLASLGTHHVDGPWIVAWEDYFRETERRQVRFVFQTGDRDLLDFPIELLPFENGFLGQRVPVVKEILGLRRAAPYRSAGCLRAGMPLNALLVACGAGGKYGSFDLPDLPQVAAEVSGVCAALRAAAQAGTLAIDHILVLTDLPNLDVAGATIQTATADSVGRALRGELGSDYHLLHFSGHYACGADDTTSGPLLSAGAKKLALLSLASLFQQLEGRPVEFAFFNGCNSGNHREMGLQYLGAAYTCLTAGVPAVVGMRWPMLDHEACALAVRFYNELARSGLAERALLATRRWAETAFPGTLWAAPVMLTC